MESCYSRIYYVIRNEHFISCLLTCSVWYFKHRINGSGDYIDYINCSILSGIKDWKASAQETNFVGKLQGGTADIWKRKRTLKT